MNKTKKFLNVFLLCMFLSSLLLTSCGQTIESENVTELDDIASFREDVDTLCNEFTYYDAQINSLDFDSPQANDELIAYLSELNNLYNRFSALVFPQDYLYLKDLATEAQEYMNISFEFFQTVYTSEELDSDTLTSHYTYALENYDRAYKRIQVIISMLNEAEQ